MSKAVQMSRNRGSGGSDTVAHLSRFPTKSVDFRAPDVNLRTYTGVLLSEVVNDCKSTGRTTNPCARTTY